MIKTDRSISRTAVLGAMLISLAAVRTNAMAQTIEYPRQMPKDSAATEDAGIGSYILTREQGEVSSASVEALDVKGQPLASCEIEWFEDSKAMTCTMPDGGLFRATWYKERAEFEDLVGGDHISLFVEGGPSRGAIDMEPGSSRPERGGWVVRGTKTWEEAERDWGHITPIFGYLLAEVEITLGILSNKLSGGNHASPSDP